MEIITTIFEFISTYFKMLWSISPLCAILGIAIVVLGVVVGIGILKWMDEGDDDDIDWWINNRGF